jgi:hypothetical protein
MLSFFNKTLSKHDEEIMMLKAQVAALKKIVEAHHVEYIRVIKTRTPEWKLVRDFLNPDRDELS